MVLSGDDLEAAAARLTEAGWSTTGVQDISEGRALMVADPDGNRVVLTGP